MFRQASPDRASFILFILSILSKKTKKGRTRDSSRVLPFYSPRGVTRLERRRLGGSCGLEPKPRTFRAWVVMLYPGLYLLYHIHTLNFKGAKRYLDNLCGKVKRLRFLGQSSYLYILIEDPYTYLV